MTRDNTLFLVITSCITGKLKNFSSEVLKNSSHIDWGDEKISCFEHNERAADVANPERQHQHAGRSCPSSTNGGHDQRGTEDPPSRSANELSQYPRLIFHRKWICQIFLPRRFVVLLLMRQNPSVRIKRTFAALWNSMAHHNMPPVSNIASHTITIIYLHVGNTKQR